MSSSEKSRSLPPHVLPEHLNVDGLVVLGGEVPCDPPELCHQEALQVVDLQIRRVPHLRHKDTKMINCPVIEN